MNKLPDFEYDLKQSLLTLTQGGIILYPTDTIWGVGCDATNDKAILRIYDIKKRARNNPFIVLVHNMTMLINYVEEVPQIAFKLLENATHPLTLIFPKAKNISEYACGQDGSIAIRIVDDPFCKALISNLKKPIVSTSANISGESNPTNFTEISPFIRNSVDYIVHYRQNDTIKRMPSSIVKILPDNNFQIIR